MKTEQAAAERRLDLAYQAGIQSGNTNGRGPLLYRALRAGVRAALPGRQQKRNLGPHLREAVKAASRAMRRA